MAVVHKIDISMHKQCEWRVHSRQQTDIRDMAREREGVVSYSRLAEFGHLCSASDSIWAMCVCV